MTAISIITPWYGPTHDLIPDYAAAVAGAEVIAVDNATPPETRDAIAAQGWRVIRNEHNAGFAAGNNQGFAAATGDVIVFLNSDVAAPPAFLSCVAHDVRDGYLYGPSLAQQLVYGMWLPYLEGWCIAATRATWERLIMAWNCEHRIGYGDAAHLGPYQELTHTVIKGEHATGVSEKRIANTSVISYGPWDASAFPGPYWEDNDLCLRAMRAGVGLVQTAWPIQHKGGRSAGAILKWGETFERNRATFAARVADVWREVIK